MVIMDLIFISEMIYEKVQGHLNHPIHHPFIHHVLNPYYFNIIDNKINV